MADVEVPSSLDRAAAIAWRLIVIAVVAYAALTLLQQLGLVVFPIYVALLLAVVLEPLNRRLRRVFPPALAAWATLLAFIGGLVVVGMFVVPAIADEAGDLEQTLTEGVDEVSDWIVDDSPFDVSRSELADLRADAGDALANLVRDNQDRLLSSALIAFEVLAGAVLSLVILFFLLKDGGRFQQFMLLRFDEENRDAASAVGARVWETLRGYMIGSATLGVIEGTVLGVTLALVGGSLAVPVAVITFFAAFIPFVGAVTAGIIAVLIALVTAGPVPALVVAAVALIVQQFDSDLLAPIVFGKALDLHPLVILLSITAFGAVGGIAGAFIAVPVTASLANGVTAWRNARPAGAPLLPERNT